MLSGINNNTQQINFTSNHIVQLKNAQFDRFFQGNPQFSELRKAKTLNKLPIFECLCFLDVLKFKRQMVRDLFDEGCRAFFPTVLGKKPSAILSAKSDMHYLNKVLYPNKMDIIHLKPQENGFFDKTYNTYILNKDEVMKTIERNREIYTNRLKLHPENSTKYIYKKLKEALKDDTGKYGRIDDILGITLGYPKENSMIYQLEKSAGINIESRKSVLSYQKKLLDFFKDEKFPYKNLSKQELNELKQHIKKIRKIKHHHNAVYDFVKFVEEPEEMKRITESVNDYVKGFRIDTFA